MIREDLGSRESEIIRTLSSLPEGFFVIGGYATSALSIHRFSVDCDIVISGKDAKKFIDHLVERGYKKEKAAKDFDEAYKSEVEIYAKKVKGARVSIDLFIKGLTSRGTEASWSYEYIRDNSTEAIVAGADNSTGVMTPRKELLMAMKIHSGRDVDMRDIVMLSERVDWSAVTKHADRGKRDALTKQLTNMIGRMDDEQFAQSLRATFSIRRSVDPLIARCRRNLSVVRKSLES
jgi:hypothetical protein